MITQNTYNYSNQQSSLTLELGAKIGNAYVDTGYAGYGLYEAAQQLEKASKKLDELIKLKNEGKASQHAVDIAGIAVAMAVLNLENATLQLASSAAGAATAASNSFGTGFYGAGYANIAAQTSTTQTSASEAVGSLITSKNNFNLTSKNLDITGSTVGSVNGKTTVDVTENLTLKQGENHYSFEQKSGSVSIGLQVGTAGYRPNEATVGFSDHEREQTNYTKAVILGQENEIKSSLFDDSQNNLADYSMINADSDAMINADSDATMSIDLRFLTKSGRQDIANDLNNIGSGKVFTDNYQVMKTNFNTVQNLGESTVNTIKGALGKETNVDDMTFGHTYEVMQKSFENQTKAMNGQLSPADMISQQTLDKTKTYDTTKGDAGKMAGFYDKTNDVIAVNKNENNTKSIQEILPHEDAHLNFGSNEAVATQIGARTNELYDAYNGKFGFNDFNSAWGKVVADAQGLSDGYVDGVRFGEVDPLIIVGRGTFSGEKPLTPEEIASLERSTGQKVIQVLWPAGNDKASRTIGAQNIKNVLDSYVFDANEPLYFAGHSNFGNVIKEFSQGSEYGGYKVSENQVINTILGRQNTEQNYTLKPAKTIDGVFMFATPHRDDYWFNDKSMSSSDAPKVSFYDPIDIVQKHGWIDSKVIGFDNESANQLWAAVKGAINGPKDIQKLDGFQNIAVNQKDSGPISSHSAIFTPPVFDEYLPQVINKK